MADMVDMGEMTEPVPEPKKKGFWGSLLRRSKSNALNGKLTKEPHTRTVSDGDRLASRRRGQDVVDRVRSLRRRPRRPQPMDPKGKGKEGPNGHVYGATPLSEWPPSGVPSEEELIQAHATELICKGAPIFQGQKRSVAHRSDQYYHLCAITDGTKGDETDHANAHDGMTQLTTLRIQGSKRPSRPWETLEQPSLAYGWGRIDGTITLNHWVGLSNSMPPPLELRDPGVSPRNVDLEQIFGRLRDLEAGLEDDDEELMYRNLYRRLLRDPDKLFAPHKSMETQIADLITVLSKPDWIDFTIPKNQVVTKFIFDIEQSNQEQYQKFFHQLLLSLELDLRINSRLHNDWAKEKLMDQIPPRIQWNLALSRRWRDNVRIDDYGKTPDMIRLRFKLRKRQAKMLKRFAQMMRWPELTGTLESLRQRDAEGSLMDVSSHTMAFFSGLVLPGLTFPFLIMNTLVDIDPDKATDHLALLTHLYPCSGFQYKNSYTYWSASCIVGKVLAPTCLQVAGWVGPARPTVDLERSEIARIRSRKARQRITPDDVVSMGERSEPLGPPAEVYPVQEYDLLMPDPDDFVDTVRVEQLNMAGLPKRQDSGPNWFDASILFSIDGVSWPLRLSYDVSFVTAWPCSEGPHPLFFDYGHAVIRADEVVSIQDWGQSKGRSAMSTPVDGSSAPRSPTSSDDDTEKVLVVEAFGVKDNEVLARAWCAHWGLNALVADISKTCLACAIREAYAATLTVLIVVEDPGEDFV